MFWLKYSKYINTGTVYQEMNITSVLMVRLGYLKRNALMSGHMICNHLSCLKARCFCIPGKIGLSRRLGSNRNGRSYCSITAFLGIPKRMKGLLTIASAFEMLTRARRNNCGWCMLPESFETTHKNCTTYPNITAQHTAHRPVIPPGQFTWHNGKRLQ